VPLLRAFDAVLTALAALLAVSLLVAGWHDVSQGYDVWYYHLPFAARLAGIMDANAYAFSAENQARYEGFPLLSELLQGLFWRITRHVEATSLLSVGALLAIPVFLKRAFAVPPHLALLGFLAVPLVHIHATSGYVDLPANACATVLLLCVHRALVSGEAPLRLLAPSALLAAAAANMKFQLVPIVSLASLVLAAVALRGVRSWASSDRKARGELLQRAGVVAIAIPLVFATPIKNAVVHGNPVWPVELHVLGRSLPHVEAAYAQAPRHLADSSRPVRFVRSVLEIDNLPIATQRRWSLDQWAPPDAPSCRMGGFFGAYVALNLAALGWIAARRRSREDLAAAGLFGGVTIVAALVPQSHELRYYMHWMLLLVSLNLVLWARAGPATRAALALVALVALVVVVWSTDAAYLYASGSTFEQFLAKRSDRSIVESAEKGARLCISREPFTFLYAPAFYPGHDYSVQEATTEADCSGARRIP
jgi:hypothetical protein